MRLEAQGADNDVKQLILDGLRALFGTLGHLQTAAQIVEFGKGALMARFYRFTHPKDIYKS